MLCEKCGKNNATVLYTQIINGQKSTLHICSACAAQESIFENFGSLLSFSPREEFSVKMCPVCSTTLSEFSKTGRLGCGECYKTFRKNADAMLKKIHGTSKHIAEKKEETPLKEEKPKSEIEALKDKLKAAIEEENFEEAARLRDAIREMEKGDEK
ncbi:MAG: UvrB/UvrC motif-containing protein [Clostridia bacterium]|nr:UvrB/UvrC motif-containing protein [Clostridia bacterium]